MKEAIEEIRARAKEIEQLNTEYDVAQAFEPETERSAEKATEKSEETRQKMIKATFAIKKALKKAEKEIAQNA